MTNDGLMFVLMHQGGEWTHKQFGTEVWVFDAAKKTRVGRIKLKTPAYSIYVSNSDKPILYALSLLKSQMDEYADAGWKIFRCCRTARHAIPGAGTIASDVHSRSSSFVDDINRAGIVFGASSAIKFADVRRVSRHSRELSDRSGEFGDAVVAAIVPMAEVTGAVGILMPSKPRAAARYPAHPACGFHRCNSDQSDARAIARRLRMFRAGAAPAA